MVLSMLSAIQNVKLPSSNNTTSTNSLVAVNSNQDETSKEDQQSHSLPRATDMSRRKQRNPKPIFNNSEEDKKDQDDINANDHNISRDTNLSEEDSIQEELHSMIKVEVHETDASISPPMSSSRSVPPQTPMTPTPPPSTSTGINNRLIPNLPPLHLPGGGGVRPPSTLVHHPAAEQLMLNHTSELLAKQNMFFFGDVTVAEHPDAPPVPMVIPMVYLYPLQTAAVASANNKESIKYRMFVPLGGGMGPELLAPPPGVAPPPGLLDPRAPSRGSVGGGGGPSSPPLLGLGNLPRLEKARSESDLGEETVIPRPGASSTPLDLSKSPEANNNRAAATPGDVAGGGSMSDTEAADPLSLVPGGDHQRPPLPPLRRGSLVKDEDLRSHQREIESHLQFLKAKQLEFLKGQQQKQAVALAAAQAAAVASQQKSRCEECNINFSKHQNYVAHKRYYCSAASGGPASSTGCGGGNSAASNSKASVSGLPNIAGLSSDNDEDKSSDDGICNNKSQRKLSPPMTSPNLIMGLTSPKESSGKNDHAKELLLLKQQQELLKSAAAQAAAHQENSNDSTKSSQVSPPGLMIPPPGMTTPPLPHFVCEGCGIKFKSVSNLQAHQARYCAGLRKASEEAFEAMMLKQKQQQQQQQQQQKATIPMLEMMSLLNAKSSGVEPEKLSSLMMSSMMAAMSSAANASSSSSSGNSNGQNGDDYCCILCGYKEQSVDRLKDHINLHFIGQVKRKHEEATKENNGAESNASSLAKKMKIKEENETTSSTSSSTTSEVPQLMPQLLQVSKHSRPGSPQNNPLSSRSSPPSSTENAEQPSTVASSTGQLKCNSCDIGFSHLSNFVAHKKYYCRGMQATLRNISTASKEGSNGSESPSK